MPPLIFLIAGEASGDQLGAPLMRALKESYGGHVRFAGIGGPLMQAEGLESLFPMEELSIMGIGGILKQLPQLLGRIRQTVEAIRDQKPAAVITIDAPEFSFRVAKKVRAFQDRPRLVHYVAPTVWAWRAGRAKKIAKIYDHLLCLYPFEPPLFEKEGLPATFVGHPIVITPMGDGAAFRAKHTIDPAVPLLCVLPGSRSSELKFLLPIFGDVVKKLHQKDSSLRIVVPALASRQGVIRTAIQDWPGNPIVVLGDAGRRDAFAASTLALAASGTVAMQLAMAGLPFVIAYKMSAFVGRIGRMIVKTPWGCMINILLQKGVVPEFIQEYCKADLISPVVDQLLENKSARNKQMQDLQKAMESLTLPQKESPATKAAKIVVSLI